MTLQAILYKEGGIFCDSFVSLMIESALFMKDIFVYSVDILVIFLENEE